MEAALYPAARNDYSARRVAPGVNAVIFAPADQRVDDLVFAKGEIKCIVITIREGVVIVREIEQRAVADGHRTAVKLADGLAALHHTAVDSELSILSVECLSDIIDKEAVRKSGSRLFTQKKGGLFVSVRTGDAVGYKPPRVATAASYK